MFEITAEHFDKWMDDFVDHPDEFDQEWQSVVQHLEERGAEIPHTYGERCMAYLEAMELPESGQETPPLV